MKTMSADKTSNMIQMTGQRGLGLGFGEGNAFHLFSHEPNRGLVNNVNFSDNFLLEVKNKIQHIVNIEHSSVLSVLTKAVESKLDGVTNEQIEDIVKDILALTIPDILVDINITRLEKIIPSIINEFSNEIINLFEKNKLNYFQDDGGKRFLRSIVLSKYELFTSENIEEEIKNKIDEIEKNLTIDNINFIDSDIIAYLIPAMIDRMNDDELRKVAYEIANQLDSKYLLAVADKNYFIPDIIAANDEKMIIKNANKRSLQFFSNSNNTRVHFRGADYTLQHTHIHFEKDGEENEYDLDGEKFDGEIHTVFEFNHKGNPNKKRLMAIGFPLKIGNEDNPQISELLHSINQLEEVIQWKRSDKKDDLTLNMKQLDISTNYKKLFMEYFDQAKNQDSLIYHSWASLRSSTYGFRTGLRFVIAPFAITMSEAQYKELKEIFGEMNRNLKEEDKLDPIDRKAGFRKQRTTISKFLEEKVNSLSSQNLLQTKL